MGVCRGGALSSPPPSSPSPTWQSVAWGPSVTPSTPTPTLHPSPGLLLLLPIVELLLLLHSPTTRWHLCIHGRRGAAPKGAVPTMIARVQYILLLGVLASPPATTVLLHDEVNVGLNQELSQQD